MVTTFALSLGESSDSSHASSVQQVAAMVGRARVIDDAEQCACEHGELGTSGQVLPSQQATAVEQTTALVDEVAAAQVGSVQALEM